MAVTSAPVTAQVGVWDLGARPAGELWPTEVSAKNRSCEKKKLDFEVTIHGEARQFLVLAGASVIHGLAMGEIGSVPAVLDLRSVAPGRHDEGWIEIRCLNCSGKCEQDRLTVPIRLGVVAPRQGGGGTVIERHPESGTTSRCPAAEDCEELYRLARLADEHAKDASAAAAEAERMQPQRDADSAELDDRAAGFERDADRHADDAAAYRKLADSARQLGDPATAARRDAEAAQNAAEAERLDGLARDLQRRAEELRGAARRAREASDAADAAAAAAWQAFWDCVQRARQVCPPPATAGTRTRVPSSGGPTPGTPPPGGTGTKGMPPPGGGTKTNPPPEGGTQPPRMKLGGTYQGMEEATVCKWYTYRAGDPEHERELAGRAARWQAAGLPPEENPDPAPTYFIRRVERARSLEMDDVSILEVAVDVLEGHTRSPIGFRYHCTEPGTVAVRYQVSLDGKTWEWRWVRIVCRDSYGWPWEWFE